MIYTSRQIVDKIKSEHKNVDVFITDSNYVLPDIKWLIGDFYNKMFINWVANNNLSTWKKYFDCDNFGFLYYVFVNIAHAKTMRLRELNNKPIYQGVGVGVMFYKTFSNSSAENIGVGHAINIIITEKGVKYIEPQNGKEIYLNQKERDSAWLIVI